MGVYILLSGMDSYIWIYMGASAGWILMVSQISRRVCILCHKKVWWSDKEQSFVCPTHGKLSELDVIREKINFLSLTTFLK